MNDVWLILDRKSLALRGLVAVIFGVLALLITGVVLDFLVWVFGFFAIAFGVLNAGVGLSSEKTYLPRWLLVTTGVLGILVGIFAFVMPLITAIALTILIAAWALVTGVSDLGLAVSHTRPPHRVLLAISGIIGILFALVLVISPAIGAYALVIILGLYALVFGCISIFLGLSMGRGGAVVDSASL